tara:strand:+ start:1636 stop:2670 length:1035 start_codon:yes stop_codon:yes gene_type:complete
MSRASITLKELSEYLEGRLVGAPDKSIDSIASIKEATNSQLTFLSDLKMRELIPQTQAGVILLPQNIDVECDSAVIYVDNPYFAFAKSAQLLDPTPKLVEDIHPTAVIDPTAEIGDDVAIGAYTVIGAGVKIGSGCQIASGCSIGQRVTLGSECKIYPNVTLYHGVSLGYHCTVHASSVIGSDGFGFAHHAGNWEKIPQTGRVIIGDHVDIGASCTIDRGALSDTVIESGVIIDNQVHIAHNVHIGQGTAIAGCAGIAGSTRIGRFCQIGGQSAISGHIELGDHVHLTGCAMVTHSIHEPGVYSSMIPASNHRSWLRSVARIRQLEKFFSKFKKLDQYVSMLKR